MSFTKIGLFAKYNSRSLTPTFQELVSYLKDYELFVESKSAQLLNSGNFTIVDRATMSAQIDLLIVVGGDGSILNAGRAVIDTPVPIVGINRGRLGFLADIHPDDFKTSLAAILQGHYVSEQRLLLTLQTHDETQNPVKGNALNDIVLYNANLSRMIEFDVYINDNFIMRQRSDGLIIATPTGSTAYALSGGGPILTPHTEAFVLVPMFPHTLSSRPIVINKNDRIILHISPDNEIAPKLSCDGQLYYSLHLDQKIMITAHPNQLTLIHPENYDYFHVLQHKLGWHSSTHDNVRIHRTNKDYGSPR